MKVTLITVLLLFTLAAPVAAHAQAPPGLVLADSTAYCLRGTMADGTYTRDRSAASNWHPLGTRIRLVGPRTGPRGMRRYVIRDRIGHGTSLDLWMPSCGMAIAFGRQTLTYKLGWRKL